jgi:hypothetical protein
MQTTLPSTSNHARWSLLAMQRLGSAISQFLGMDLHEDGSVTVHGLEEPRRTVDLVAPFGPVAHNVQLLRGRPQRILAFYQAYSRACLRLGRRSQSFEGQLEALTAAMGEVPCEPRPVLRRIS